MDKKDLLFVYMAKLYSLHIMYSAKTKEASRSLKKAAKQRIVITSQPTF